MCGWTHDAFLPTEVAFNLCCSLALLHDLVGSEGDLGSTLLCRRCPKRSVNLQQFLGGGNLSTCGAACVPGNYPRGKYGLLPVRRNRVFALATRNPPALLRAPSIFLMTQTTGIDPCPIFAPRPPLSLRFACMASLMGKTIRSAIEALQKEKEDEEKRWRTQRRAHPTSPGALCAPDLSLVHLMVRFLNLVVSFDYFPAATTW